MAEKYRCKQLIDGDGKFYASRFKKFVEKVGMDNWGDSFTVVSIMGPQISGKSTLLNHLFDTNFRTMNASEGRNQTTRGVWVAVSEPRTLVVDMEGSDSSERGPNDTIFEKWSALFALAISDIVLINMWCQDIGREYAASKPLLRTVFKVILRISNPRKVTLMFVLRNITKTPLEILRKRVLEDMEKIWNSIGRGKQLKEFFDVKVEALCDYENKEEKFKEEVAELKKKICGVDIDQSNIVPASSFPSKAEKIWEDIKDRKDLNILTMKETDPNRNRRRAALVALSVSALSAVGISAVGLAIPGMQGVAVTMIAVAAGLSSELFASYRQRIKEEREKPTLTGSGRRRLRLL